jgi:predicted DNA-binding transcriptional regulator AlpA
MAALGGAQRESTAMKRRRSVQYRTRHHDHISGLQLWLKTNPERFGITDYDRWVAVESKAGNEEEVTFVRGRAISKSLVLGWGDLLRVARGEVTIEGAHREGASAAKPTKMRGPHDLISLQDVVELLNSTRDQAEHETYKARFPRPVLLMSRRRFWIRGDVLAYLAGKEIPQRQENELRDEYLGLREMQDMTGLGSAVLEDGARGVPAPVAYVGGRFLWLRREVEPALTRRPKRRNRS